MAWRHFPLVLTALLLGATLPVVSTNASEAGLRPVEQDLLRVLRAPYSDPLAHGVGVADVASRHQAAALGLAWVERDAATAHALPSEALLALALRHGVAPDGETLQRILALDAADPATRDALTSFVDAYLALDDAAQAAYSGAEADLAPIFPARSAFLATVPPLRDALAGHESAAACAPIVVPEVLALDLAGCDFTYTENATLSLDVGGSDKYYNNAGGTNGYEHEELGCLAGYQKNGSSPLYLAHSAALVDLGPEDDAYGNASAPRGCAVNGGGMSGVGLLLDEGGNDAYVAKGDGTNGGGGGGGVGLLLDLAGNDAYRGGDFAVNGGAGPNAGGLLIDLGDGNDTYDAGSIGTNGGAEGDAVGFLLDAGGTDAYRAGARATNGGGVWFPLLVPWIAGPALLLDAGGDGDTYLDLSTVCNGSGTDRTLAPKCIVGAQVDA